MLVRALAPVSAAPVTLLEEFTSVTTATSIYLFTIFSSGLSSRWDLVEMIKILIFIINRRPERKLREGVCFQSSFFRFLLISNVYRMLPDSFEPFVILTPTFVESCWDEIRLCLVLSYSILCKTWFSWLHLSHRLLFHKQLSNPFWGQRMILCLGNMWSAAYNRHHLLDRLASDLFLE